MNNIEIAETRKEIALIRQRLYKLEKRLDEEERNNLESEYNRTEDYNEYLNYNEANQINMENNQNYSEEYQGDINGNQSYNENYQENINGNQNYNENYQGNISNTATNRIQGSVVNNRNTEQNIGKYILGILASLLLITATIMFAKLIWNEIPNSAKMVGILSIAIGISCIGYIQSRKGKNRTFWCSVIGSGISVAFIDIIVGNILWNLYGIIATIGLVVSWIILTLLIAVKTRSTIIYIIEYLGNIITVLLVNEHFELINNIHIGDQIIYSAIIMTLIAINVTYKTLNNSDKLKPILAYLDVGFNLYTLSIVMKLIQSVKDKESLVIIAGLAIIVVIWLNIIVQIDYNTESKTKRIVWGIISLITQMLMIHTLWYNFESVFKLKEFEVVTSLVSLGVIISIGAIIAKIGYDYILYSTLSCIIAVHIAGFAKTDSIIFGAIVGIIYTYSLLITRFNKKEILISHYLINIINIFLLFSDDCGKQSIIIAEVIILITTLIGEYIELLILKDKHIIIWQTIIIVFCGIVYIKLVDELDYSIMPMIFAISALLCTQRIFIEKIINSENNKYYINVNKNLIGERIMYIVIIFNIHLFCYLAGWFCDSSIDKMCLMYTLMILSGTSIYISLFGNHRNTISAILTIISYNSNMWYMHSIMYDSDSVIVVSLIGMALSALVITLGFIRQYKTIRIIGLINLIIYVLKIVLFDVSYATNSGANVLMLLVASLICFGISYLYNRLELKYGSTDIQNS